ncbi:sodium-dependent transporter [Pseudobacteriovorax antillogorgiicola]|uniref:Transporter n=1 Tax=Pseudobacteriovorax antillogorgiicola TaxID=1513793 RepID=A0A1Y6CVJ5_9BACT|nr:sodium-dependent transporter [Pseudobacteriovorax antillogorgiicola]TCS43500.1 NSS family neurotransmitter:Na+ symporter [Pseudobacteriovorax antillogorgiicola]SMF81146.1 neurotransmitter:Na+ symporter, NSS family [Pseudobacteriovorax antillogorgiicola]
MRSHWSGRLAFILAASGSAIGLGNIWKFPYITGQNGGGAFVLAYLITILLVGFPIFIAEIYIGQKAQKNAVSAFDVVHGKPSPFKAIGAMGVLSAFLILSFYSVVGGWILSFEWQALTGGFSNKAPEQIEGMLGALISDPVQVLAWHTGFMVLTAAIVIGGISKGIERWSKILMPGFFALLIALLVFSMSLDGFGDAFAFLFQPDFAKLTGESLLEAVGHSFFTLSLGMGAMITYGSYLAKGENLVKTAAAVTFLDTLIALIAGLVMFSVTFTYGLEPGSGPGLMFSTMPTLFSQMSFGSILLIAFFALVGFAALTSAISLLEVVVSYFVEEKNMSQKQATLLFAGIIWAVGVLCALSFNVLQGTFDFFDTFDKTTTNILMPLGGLLTAVFFGWCIPSSEVERIVGGKTIFATGLTFVSRFVAPIGVGVVMVVGLINWLF